MEHEHTYQAGQVLGNHYEVLATVAKGGMGTVYLACDSRSRNSLVALKVLDQELLTAKDALARFRGEVVASYRVEHPNVVKALEYFDEPGFQAYAMEYVDGGSLKGALRDGALDPQFAVSILKQIAAGLAAIHQAGIVHRDLKPENILLGKKGEVKITDFGVARVHQLQSVTHLGNLVGTAHYVAPEYVETGECDHRGDIYALGVIAYEMLSGSPPFPVQTSVASLAARFRTPVVPLRDKAPQVPAKLADWVRRAMAFKIGERYQDVPAMVRDLENVFSSKAAELEEAFEGWAGARNVQESALVETVRIPKHAASLARRRPVMNPKLLILVLAGIALGVIILWGVVAQQAEQSSPDQDETLRQELLSQ